MKLKNIAIAALVMCLLLTGCGPSAPTEASAPSEALSEIDNVDFDSLTFVDIAKTDTGYTLLCDGEQAVCIRLDKDLQETAREPLAVDFPQALAVEDGHTYVLGINERNDEDHSLAVFCDGTLYAETQIKPRAYHNSVDFAVCNGTFFLCVDNQLYIDGRSVDLPLDGTAWSAAGLISVDGQLQVQLVSREASGTDTAQRVQVRLVPISQDTVSISATDGTEFPSLIQGSCTTETATYILTDGYLADLDTPSDKLCVPSELGVDLSVQIRMVPYGDGGFLSLSQSALTPFYPTVTQGQVLTIGCSEVTAAMLSASITKFNRSHPALSVSVKQYADQSALNLGLVNGEIDLIAVESYGVIRNYAEKDLLLSLEELTPDILQQALPNIVEMSRCNGVCSFLPQYVFPVVTFCPASDFADQTVPDDFAAFAQRAAEAEPEVFLKTTKTQVLSDILYESGVSWVDYTTGTASFDSEEFLSVLTFADRFVMTHEEVSANHPESQNTMIGYFLTTPVAYQDLCVADELKGRSALTCIPLPTQQKLGYCLSPSRFLAAVQTTENAEGCAAFLSFMFSKDSWEFAPTDGKTGVPSNMGMGYDTVDGFPIIRDWFDEIMQYYIAASEKEFKENPDERRAAVHQGFVDACNTFQNIVEQSDHFMTSNTTDEVGIIVMEEALVFFNGDCTAQQAAERIQSRVTIYLAEQG